VIAGNKNNISSKTKDSFDLGSGARSYILVL